MLTYRCPPAAYDELTGVCSAPEWVDVPGLLPALSVGDAALIGSAIIGVWAIGFSFKVLRKFIFR